ncbi:MarR family transcriptional regulator [Streptomyces sp. NPDC056161]|uniref:MarR family transcriptional regulator n=1 Tax=Streptomyces sp. NPDC056161 TaxID=3345732 RepID=UPI0035E2FA0B
MASPGYGKRTVPAEPGTAARVPTDFSHLPAREAYIAGFIEGLPDGAAMDIKSLAKVVPLYGQQAVRSALTSLSRAGHLHRARGLAAVGEVGTRWVFRTYWSRTARDDAWWAAFLDAGEAPDGSAPTPGNPVNPTTGLTAPSIDAPDVPQPVESLPVGSHATTAYHVLARLGSREPRLALSAADCQALADLVIPWLECGASALTVTHALTGGLPDVVHSPRGFVARRLRDKLPPVPVPVAVPVSGSVPDNRLFMPECTDCGVPGRPSAFNGGLCRGCRRRTATSDAHPPATAVVQVMAPGAEMNRRTAVAFARDALATRSRERREPAQSRLAGSLQL